MRRYGQYTLASIPKQVAMVYLKQTVGTTRPSSITTIALALRDSMTMVQ